LDIWSAQHHPGYINGFSPGAWWAKGGMFVKVTMPGIRFFEVILLESPMSVSPYETAKSKLAH
jgi:hypothetical protein